MAEPQPQRAVLFGSFDAALHPRVAVLSEGIADSWELLTVNEPLGLSTADKLDAASSVAGALRLARAIARAWVPLRRRGHRASRDPDLVVVGYMGHFDVHLARLLWPNARIALDHMVGLAETARDRGVATGAKLALLRSLDRAALRRADVIIVDTEEQRDELPSDLVAASVVVPVGATQVWFGAQAAPPDSPVRVCFVGLYTPLHGSTVIAEAIAQLADDERFEFTMVGTGQDRVRAQQLAAPNPRVRWIDWVDSADLPALVASHHVSLGIFGTTPKASRVVPTKVYQGLAAGATVVTSDTAPQRRALSDAAIYVPPGDPSALADTLRSFAQHPDSMRPDRRHGERFRSAAVVQPLLDRADELPTRHSLSPGPALPPNAWLRFDVLRPFLEAVPRGRVLEIGPGRGAVATRLVDAGHDYTGVEMSDDARSATRTALVEVAGSGSPPRLVADISEIGDETYNLVCAFEVLEHIEDDIGALTAWASQLAPGGRLLVSVPAWRHRFAAHDTEVGHLRRYDPDDLRAVAGAAGLVDIEVHVYGAPLGFVLERIRNTMATRIQRNSQVADESAIERTKRSGGWFQPPRSINRVIELATLPFRLLQRRLPGRGTGLVLAARAPGRR